MRSVMTRRALDTLVLFTVTVAVVWAGYHWSGSARSFDMSTRTPVFFTAGAWIFAECVLMALRTEADLWDRFSWGLFIARLATANYIGMQAVSFGHWATFPDWYWSFSRTLFGISAAFIFLIVVREIVLSFRKAPRWRKERAAIAIVAVVTYVSILVAIW